jgi:RNA polymerase primary sigma factor
MLDRPTDTTAAKYINPPGVDELVLRWQRDKDERARDLLTVRYWSLIRLIGLRWAKNWELDPDDATQEAALGFLRAVDLYDARLCTLASYVNTWSKSKVGRLRDTAGTIRVPVHIHDRNRVMGKAAARLRHKLGRSPVPAELAAEIGVPVARINSVIEANVLVRGRLASLSTPVGEEEDAELGDFIAADEGGRPDVQGLGRREAAQARTAILQAAELLPERWRAVMSLRLVAGLSLAETGERLGVTRERIRQLEAKVVMTLREALRYDPRALHLIGLDVEPPATISRADATGLLIGEVAAATGLARPDIENMTAAGTFPNPSATTGMGQRLWNPEDVAAWIANRDAASAPVAA